MKIWPTCMCGEAYREDNGHFPSCEVQKAFDALDGELESLRLKLENAEQLFSVCEQERDAALLRLGSCELALRGLVDVHENAKGPESMIALDAARAYLRSAVERQRCFAGGCENPSVAGSNFCAKHDEYYASADASERDTAETSTPKADQWTAEDIERFKASGVAPYTDDELRLGGRATTRKLTDSAD